jgi:hypothetical protein
MEYLKILFAVLTAVIGWVAGHYFTSRRDLASSRRSVRIDALVTCYKALIRSGIDGVMLKRDDSGRVINNAVPVEDAIALIHLYGDAQQSALASAYAKQIADTGKGSATDLVNSLRRDIRGMLGAGDLLSEPVYLRVKPNGGPV